MKSDPESELSKLRFSEKELHQKNSDLRAKVAELSAEIKMQTKLQEAIVNAAVATASKEMEVAAHKSFKEGMAYAQQFTAASRQMV